MIELLNLSRAGMNFKVAQIDDIKPGQGKAIEVAGKTIGLFNIKGEFFAVDNACSHMGAPLCQGLLAGKTITCEWHGATFNLETGEAECAPARGNIQTYKVVVEGKDLFVEVVADASETVE